MDRTKLVEHLAQAEQDVAESEQHVADQKALIRRMVEGGHDVAQESELLRQFEEIRLLHIAHRDRLLKALASEA